jgi:hypothetical protein
VRRSFDNLLDQLSDVQAGTGHQSGVMAGGRGLCDDNEIGMNSFKIGNLTRCFVVVSTTLNERTRSTFSKKVFKDFVQKKSKKNICISTTFVKYIYFFQKYLAPQNCLKSETK